MAYLATPKIVDLLFFGHGESTTAINCSQQKARC